MVELIAYCVYATLPPRGPRVANAKRFCYSVCQLFGTSLWFYFLFFFSCLVCSVLPYLCLWVKFSGFWLAKFLHLPWHIGIFVILQGGEFNEIRWATMTTTFASNLNLMWLHISQHSLFWPPQSCNAVQLNQNLLHIRAVVRSRVFGGKPYHRI